MYFTFLVVVEEVTQTYVLVAVVEVTGVAVVEITGIVVVVEGTRVVVVVVEVTGIAVAAIVIELCTSLCILLLMK